MDKWVEAIPSLPTIKMSVSVARRRRLGGSILIPIAPFLLVLEYAPTVRTMPIEIIPKDTKEESEEIDLGWVTTNRRAPNAKPKSVPSAIQSESEDEVENDNDVDGMGEVEVDAKRAQQKKVEKELQKEANVSCTESNRTSFHVVYSLHNLNLQQ
jgi:hypothetical protein